MAKLNNEYEQEIVDRIEEMYRTLKNEENPHYVVWRQERIKEVEKELSELRKIKEYLKSMGAEEMYRVGLITKEEMKKIMNGQNEVTIKIGKLNNEYEQEIVDRIEEMYRELKYEEDTHNIICIEERIKEAEKELSELKKTKEYLKSMWAAAEMYKVGLITKEEVKKVVNGQKEITVKIV